MTEIETIESILTTKLSAGTVFEPSSVLLEESFVSSQKGTDVEEGENLVDEQWQTGPARKPLIPRYPKDIQVAAIDSTSLILGHVADGILGAIRASVVTKPANESKRKLMRYGPYIVKVTEQERESRYEQLYRAVYGVETHYHPPDLIATLDQSRNLLERYLQQQTVNECKNSLILIDGSLAAAAVVRPSSFAEKLVRDAARNGNSVVSISKTTRLLLERSRKNILSLVEGVTGPCFVGGLRERIKQNQDRYVGQIYVAKFTPLGEPFRVDLPENTPIPHDELLSLVSGLAGDYGYPEELRLAHMTCVLSAIEVLELQSAAILSYGLVMKEELRARLFPL